MWPDRRILDLFGIDVPIVLAPMAGAGGVDLAVAVAEAGGLGSLPFAMADADKMRADIGIFRQRTSAPVNVNFFTHRPPKPDAAREAAWERRLAPYYAEFGFEAPSGSAPSRASFDAAACALVEDLRPEVVSFHFGLPDPTLLTRVKAAGCRVVSSATTVAEARWLEAQGCDAIIAQGYEAGGHRGMFLPDDLASQTGTLALVPQVVDAVSVPVIAAGGIADGRGIAAVLALGAAGAQIGTAYLFTPESIVTALHRRALAEGAGRETALTNVFTGRPARGFVNRIVREVGPMSAEAPAFPTAAGATMPLRAAAEAAGSADFSPLWSGQAAGLGRSLGAGELTRRLAEEAQAALSRLAVAEQG